METIVGEDVLIVADTEKLRLAKVVAMAAVEKGERYHRAVVENLVALIEEARATKVSIKGTEIPV